MILAITHDVRASEKGKSELPVYVVLLSLFSYRFVWCCFIVIILFRLCVLRLKVYCPDVPAFLSLYMFMPPMTINLCVRGSAVGYSPAMVFPFTPTAAWEASPGLT